MSTGRHKSIKKKRSQKPPSQQVSSTTPGSPPSMAEPPRAVQQSRAVEPLAEVGQLPAMEHKNNERALARWTGAVALLTGGLVVVSAVTAVIFWRQLDAMEGQLHE